MLNASLELDLVFTLYCIVRLPFTSFSRDLPKCIELVCYLKLTRGPRATRGPGLESTGVDVEPAIFDEPNPIVQSKLA